MAKGNNIATISEQQLIAFRTCRDVFPAAATKLSNGSWNLKLNAPIGAECAGNTDHTVTAINAAALLESKKEGSYLFSRVGNTDVSGLKKIQDAVDLIVGKLSLK